MTSQNDSADSAAALVAAAGLAAAVVGVAATNDKNAALQTFAKTLRLKKDDILRANKQDMENVGELSAALSERLLLDDKAVEAMATGAESVAALPDPIGEVSALQTMPSGIRVGKMRIPLGVLLVIYESRPNVTADVAALAIKSGNAAILRGGSEARRSNLAIARCLQESLSGGALPLQTVQVVDNPDRKIVGDLLRQKDGIDLVIPRGGRQLIERVANESRIAVLKHLDGNCHLYVHEDAAVEMANNLIVNSKTRRYGVCNALESVLIHSHIAKKLLSKTAPQLVAAGVEIRGCEKTGRLINCAAATEEDFYREYLAPIVSVKIVDGLDAAVSHINHYGSGHTDGIVTENIGCAWRFLREVDSSSVMVNAATVFADGGEFGLGAEVGISTDKLHARGPVGIVGLTTQKYIVFGQGETRP